MPDHQQLRNAVLRANLALAGHGLVTLTFGNVSAVDREHGVVAIKPSGVEYERMRADDMVLLDLDGNIIAGDLRPSSDTPTHLSLYRSWPQVRAVVHTHSTHATIFAQAMKPIPCLGTTHADAFYGQVPVTRMLTPMEVEHDYERNTGLVIAECMKGHDPLAMPAILVAGHGPFVWGEDAAGAVRTAVMLEEVARMALGTLRLAPEIPLLPEYIRNRHFMRKHGPDAYYGQCAVPDENDRRISNKHG